MSSEENNYFASALASWYESNARELPWRNTTDAYTIWISEIILQQTRVEQGRDYFMRFVQRFPDARSLADADESEVLKLWQGLGYYSRARNLHFAAKQIVNDFGGKFPSSYKEIRTLKGVGEYTAAAISSFAYRLPYAVLDGNVFRVLARFFGIETPIDTNKAKKEFGELAQLLLDKRHPDRHNQAIMDFGATVCPPVSPQCYKCPIAEKCFAFANGKTASLPKKEKKIKIRTRYFNYFYIINAENTYISKRTQNDIWKNLYELPLIETKEPVSLEELVKMDFLSDLKPGKCVITEKMSVKHVLTHQIIFARFYILNFFERQTKNISNFIEIKQSEIDNYPISRLSEMFLEQIDLKR